MDFSKQKFHSKLMYTNITPSGNIKKNKFSQFSQRSGQKRRQKRVRNASESPFRQNQINTKINVRRREKDNGVKALKDTLQVSRHARSLDLSKNGNIVKQ